MGLKQIKSKIVSTEKTGKVTKAMESVSAVKMRKSQERALAGKAYAEAAIRILHRISNSQDGQRFFEDYSTDESKQCFIVITSDKGLAGNLNSAVLKGTDAALESLDKDKVSIVAYGRKAVEYYTRRGYNVVRSYTNVSDDVSLEDVYDLIDFLITEFRGKSFGKVSISYQNFVSTFEQNALLRQVLPLDPEVLEVMVKDIVPKRGKYAGTERNLTDYVYEIEPNPEDVFKEIIPRLVQVMVYHALLESKASEHSARMVAMKNATDKSKEISKDLTLVYNKIRQAVITAEVSEITGGIEAMKN
ncbi:ATP synthase F1 subunit gamma [bacterium]|nr:ATP synthase F1 subunit gamma [bacterium]